jgi:hypothetical protein
MSLLTATSSTFGGFRNLTAGIVNTNVVSAEEVTASNTVFGNTVAAGTGGVSTPSTVSGNTVTAGAGGISTSATVSGTTVTAGTGGVITTGDVTCDTLNYTALNPPIAAYSTVATLAALASSTIAPGDLVWCGQTRQLYKGLQNPVDTTVVPSGTPWGADGYLKTVLQVTQLTTNNPTFTVLYNDLMVNSAVVVPSTATRGTTGKYTISWSPQLPFKGRVQSIVPTIVSGSSVIDNVAQFASQFDRAIIVGSSTLNIFSKDYAGVDVDFSNTFPKSVVITILFSPEA